MSYYPDVTSARKYPCLLVPRMDCGVRNHKDRGAWMAQSVKPPTSAQVMISRSVSSSPASGSVLTAQSLEPVSDSVFPSLHQHYTFIMNVVSQYMYLVGQVLPFCLNFFCKIVLMLLASFPCAVLRAQRL